jgi:hypothetical protein
MEQIVSMADRAWRTMRAEAKKVFKFIKSRRRAGKKRSELFIEFDSRNCSITIGTDRIGVNAVNHSQGRLVI